MGRALRIGARAGVVMTAAVGSLALTGQTATLSYGGDPGTFPDITAPSGAASFLCTWEAEADSDGYLIYLSASSQAYPDESLYSYRYKVTGGSSTSRTISGIAAGTYYVRIAAYDGSVVRPLSHEITKVAA